MVYTLWYEVYEQGLLHGYSKQKLEELDYIYNCVKHIL